MLWTLLLIYFQASQSFQLSNVRLTKRSLIANQMPYGVASRDWRTVVANSSPESIENEEEVIDKNNGITIPESVKEVFSSFSKIKEQRELRRPPIQVDDVNLLLYDVFLIVNLSLSISFWVVHRMDFNYVGAALNEGSILSVLWITAGLYNGVFLNSAIDGHYTFDDEEGGPKAAGFLAFKTFLDTVNLRLVLALVLAFSQHRPVGSVPEEQLLPLEIGLGFVLMSVWRITHSFYTPRI